MRLKVSISVWMLTTVTVAIRQQALPAPAAYPAAFRAAPALPTPMTPVLLCQLGLRAPFTIMVTRSSTTVSVTRLSGGLRVKTRPTILVLQVQALFGWIWVAVPVHRFPAAQAQLPAQAAQLYPAALLL